MQGVLRQCICYLLCVSLLIGIFPAQGLSFHPDVQVNEDHQFIASSFDSWLPGWKYRKSHNISGAEGAGINYQIQIKVHYSYGTDSGMDVYCGENCSQDFSDIRFTGPDEETTYSYWIETTQVSDYATFWVRIEENLNHTTTIFMYYGNDFAVSESKGESTFDFFEDFQSPFNSTKWNHTGPLPTFEDGVGSFIVDAGYTWDHLAIATPTELPRRGYQLRTSMRFNTYNNFAYRYSYFGFGHSAIDSFGINGAVCIDLEDSNQNLILHTVGDEDFDEFGTVGQVHVNYRNYTLSVQPMGQVSLTDGINTVSGTLTYEISLRPSIGIHVMGAYTGNQIRTYYDYFWVMKWQPIEPQHSSWSNTAVAPWISDTDAPVFDYDIEDFPFEAGDTGWGIIWNVTELYPYRYEVIVDNVTVVQNEWESHTIEFPLPETVSLNLGPHNVTLRVIDMNLNVATDEVTVTTVDTTNPRFSTPNNLVIVEGDGLTRLIWQVYEIFPYYYSVTRGDTVIMSGPLYGNVVSVDLGTLPIGIHLLKLTVWDTSGNSGFDSVTVQVTAPTTTTTIEGTTPPPGLVFPSVDLPTMFLFGIGIIFLVAACLLIRKDSYEDMSSGYQYY